MNSNTASDCEGPWQLRTGASVRLHCYSAPPVLVRVAYFFFFYCKGCAHLLTFPPPFLLPPPAPSPEGDKLPGRLSNLGISTRSSRLVSPSFPRAQLESSLNGLHCRDDRQLRGAEDSQEPSISKKKTTF